MRTNPRDVLPLRARCSKANQPDFAAETMNHVCKARAQSFQIHNAFGLDDSLYSKGFAVEEFDLDFWFGWRFAGLVLRLGFAIDGFVLVPFDDDLLAVWCYGDPKKWLWRFQQQFFVQR